MPILNKLLTLENSVKMGLNVQLFLCTDEAEEMIAHIFLSSPYAVQIWDRIKQLYGLCVMVSTSPALWQMLLHILVSQERNDRIFISKFTSVTERVMLKA